jgi:hypothetical protein
MRADRDRVRIAITRRGFVGNAVTVPCMLRVPFEFADDEPNCERDHYCVHVLMPHNQTAMLAKER